MRNLKKFLIPFLFQVMLGCNSEKDQSPRFQDGLSANPFRQKLRIPIIDSNMSISDSRSFGHTRWESKQEIPNEGEVLHQWKNFQPYHDTDSLVEEQDGFRKKIDDSIGQQLNIYSKIKFDTIVTRSGILFNYILQHPNWERFPIHDLDERQIDSVLKSWKLYHLVLSR